jgi:hypothetical protein
VGFLMRVYRQYSVWKKQDTQGITRLVHQVEADKLTIPGFLKGFSTWQAPFFRVFDTQQ